ncbi:MAG: hypothetical protein IKS17_03840 [Firmicutes bacterium]|nr:hypothetical protein [Bacillota bacterium]
MFYYPNVNYKCLRCQLIYIDETSYYYCGKCGFALIADSKNKNKLAELGFEYKKECYMLDIDEETANSLAARYDMEQRQINGLLKALCIPLVYFICLAVFWKVPIFLQMNMLKLPEGSQTVYRTKVQASDVIGWHIRAEKVFRYDGGLEKAKKYFEDNNPKLMRYYADVYEYGGLSDQEIYSAEFDKDWLSLPISEKHKYLRVVYQRDIGEPTLIGLIDLIMLLWLLFATAKLIKTAF